MKKTILFSIASILLISCNNKSTGIQDADFMPDFSYAGYHCGEKAIPSPDHKVFNVCDFGAVADDDKTDKSAIQAAINAAEENGSGIILFPKGVYNINELEDKGVPINIKGDNIVFRGEEGTVLYMKEHNDPTNPDQMWTTPKLIIFGTAKNRVSGEKISITGNTAIGSHKLTVQSSDQFKSGDWVEISMVNNDPQRVAQEVAPYEVSETWTSINKKGVQVTVFHQISEVKDNSITLVQPIAYEIDTKDGWNIKNWNPSLENGIENITFRGGWKNEFSHHRSALDDSGWSLISYNDVANSWIRDCVFEDVNIAVAVNRSANVSVLDCDIVGNLGHCSVSGFGPTNLLIGRCSDPAGQWHAFGTSGMSMNVVVWRSEYNESTCFESHASQPRNTLLDCVKGGWHYNREGGAVSNLPSHLQNLVIWNYTRTNKNIGKVEGDQFKQEKPFVFWDTTQKWWKFIPPIVVGFGGVETEFVVDQLKVYQPTLEEGNPESLYEYQLTKRLGELPSWISNK